MAKSMIPRRAKRQRHQLLLKARPVLHQNLPIPLSPTFQRAKMRLAITMRNCHRLSNSKAGHRQDKILAVIQSLRGLPRASPADLRCLSLGHRVLMRIASFLEEAPIEERCTSSGWIVPRTSHDGPATT